MQLRRTLLAAALGLLALPAVGQATVTVTTHNPARAFAGYTTEITGNSEGRTFRVFGMNGSVAHTWSFPIAGWGFAQVVKPLSAGAILGITTETLSNRKLLVELDWAGNVRWVFDPTPLAVDVHHDFERLPNGNTLLLASAGRRFPWFRTAPVLDDVVIEIDRSGAVVWAWSTMDNASKLPLSTAEWGYLERLQQAAIFHTNSMQSLPPNPWSLTDHRFAPGNLLLSQRETNMIYILDRQSGEVVWNHRGAIGQHHARMIPGDLPGAGNILLFDNGGTAGAPPVTRAYSRVVELDPVSHREVWSYQCSSGGVLPCTAGAPTTFYSPHMGAAQRLPNGNTLITESINGRVFEVNGDGDLLWEYKSAGGRQVYRAYRWPFHWRSAEISSFAW